MADKFIGLDIGTSSIRAVEVSVSEGSRPVLEAYGQVGLSPGAVVNGEIHEREEVTKAVRHLWHDGGFTGRRVKLGVAGLRAITREMDMPPVPPEELDNAVLYEAEQVLPFPVEQASVSAQIVAEYTDAEGNPEIRVLVAAAHSELIDAMVAAVQDAGLEPISIDLNTAALARALYDPTFASGPEAIVSVGASLSMVVVHEAGQLQFVRTIDLGGQSVTEAISGALGLPLLDAERVKRSLAFPGLHDHQAVAAAQTAVTELVGEIHNSVRFYSSLPGRGDPSRLLVTGSGARTVGFLSALQNGLSVPAVPASPLAMIDSKLGLAPEAAADIDQTLAVPVGLAMPQRNGKSFNLLPSSVSAGYTERVQRGLKWIGIGLLVLIIGLTALQYLTVRSKTNSVSTLTSTLQTINTVTIPKYDKVLTLQSEVTGLQTRYFNLVRTEVDWLVVLDQFAQYMPGTAVTSGVEPVALTQLTMTAKFVPSATSEAVKPFTPKTPKTTRTGYRILATGTASSSATSYANALKLGETMVASKALFLGPITGTITTGVAVKFSSIFTVGSAAGSHRGTTFEAKRP